MNKVIGVKFKDSGKIYYFDPLELEIEKGGNVIVETARGLVFGEVAEPPRIIAEESIVAPLKPVVRVATDEDREQHEYYLSKEKEAFKTCQRKIEEHGLAMKLVDVEYAFNGSKLSFYFTADNRVDFRELVKDLAGIFKTRIDLRQIGVRDESKKMRRHRCMRASRLLQLIFNGVYSGFNKNGKVPESFAESDKNLRHLRKAYVLPEIRTGML